MLLVAIHENPATGEDEMIAASRLSKLHGTTTAEFTIVITDAYQGRGLGRLIVQRQLEIARAEGVTRITGSVLPEADAMKHIFESFGFEIRASPNGKTIQAEIDL
jgi:acetyltransferase